MEAPQGGFLLSKVPYPKPALTLDEQASLLKGRNLRLDDDTRAKHYLRFIGYYRLSGYVRFFADPQDLKHERVRDGTTFEQVLELYVFDRKLRVLLMDALERIEVAVKSEVSTSGAFHAGPFWLTDPQHFNHGQHEEIQEIINDILGEKREDHQHAFIAHFFRNYSDPTPPSWMLMEAMSFGSVSRIYKLMKGHLRLPVAKSFCLQHDILESWLHALAFGRNLCAHHSRVWNRGFTIKPKIPKAYVKTWPEASQDKVYILCCVIQHLMTVVADGSEWHVRLRDLITALPNGIPIEPMGFPKDWEKQDFWA